LEGNLIGVAIRHFIFGEQGIDVSFDDQQQSLPFRYY
jgi:hypothetical protein